MRHLSVKFQEQRDGNYYRCCTDCGEQVVLIIADDGWKVDSEPFEDGEEAPADMPEYVDVSEEVTAGYCLRCRQITSLTFNSE